MSELDDSLLAAAYTAIRIYILAGQLARLGYLLDLKHQLALSFVCFDFVSWTRVQERRRVSNVLLQLGQKLKEHYLRQKAMRF
jgi:hypothetical protein